MTFFQYINDNPLAAISIWVLLFVAIIGISVFLFRVVKIKLPFKINKISVGGVDIVAKENTSFDLSCIYADYLIRLKEIEYEELDGLQQDVREITRLYKDDFIAQMKMVNQLVYSKIVGPNKPARDCHFNTICNGEIQIIIMKQLLDIFDRGHLNEMPDIEYINTTKDHFERIKLMIYGAFADDWYHQFYPFEIFQEEVEANIDRGLRNHMVLMNKYRSLLNQKKHIRSETKRKASDARECMRNTGKLPDSEY
jgi:hypothetical protein